MQTESDGKSIDSTQLTFPRRASWRTFFQSLIAMFPVANVILITAQELLRTHPYDVLFPTWVYLVVNAAVVLSAFIAKLVAQLMLLPQVNAWIERVAPRLATRPPASPGRSKGSVD